MLLLLSLVVMGAVGFSMLKMGVLQSICGLINTILAGLLAFALWPIIAPELESAIQGSFLDHFEDALALTLVFLPALGGLRAACVNYFNQPLTLPLVVDRAGSVVFGLINGFLLSGFLICVMETLPWKEDFLNFAPTISPTKNTRPNDKLPSKMLPDAIWIKLAERLHRGSLQQSVTTPDSKVLLQFEYNTAAYRRFTDGRPPLPYPPPPPPQQKKDGVLKSATPSAGIPAPTTGGTPTTPSITPPANLPNNGLPKGVPLPGSK
jgi:hypothetical protein